MALVNSTRPCHIVMEGWVEGHDSSTSSDAVVDKQTCAKSVIDFNRETARYYSMAVGLGGSRDSTRLRNELSRCRQKAFTLARFIRKNLVPLLKHNTGAKCETEDLERLYRLFSSNLELLQLHLHSTLSLQRFFPTPRTGDIFVVNTGIVEPVLPQKSSVQDGYDIFAVDSNSFDEILVIQRQMKELGDMTLDINQRFDIRPWDAQPNSDLQQFDNKSLYSECETINGDFVTIHEPNLRRRRRCLRMVIAIVALVAITGIVLGVTLPLVKR